MKKSRLYLSGTVAGMGVLIVLFVVSSRFITVDRPEYVPERPDPAAMASLANFTSITAKGDFILELVRQDNFAVDYDPQTTYGALKVEVIDNELLLEGYGNRGTDVNSVVRIGMPVLEALEGVNLKTASITGFSADQLALTVTSVELVQLENNTLGTLSVLAAGVRHIDLLANDIGVRQLEIRSASTLVTEQE